MAFLSVRGAKGLWTRRGPNGRTLVFMGRAYLAGAVYRHPDNPRAWRFECYDRPDRLGLQPTRREAVLAVAKTAVLLGRAK